VWRGSRRRSDEFGKTLAAGAVVRGTVTGKGSDGAWGEHVGGG